MKLVGDDIFDENRRVDRKQRGHALREGGRRDDDASR